MQAAPQIFRRETFERSNVMAYLISLERKKYIYGSDLFHNLPIVLTEIVSCGECKRGFFILPNQQFHFPILF